MKVNDTGTYQGIPVRSMEQIGDNLFVQQKDDPQLFLIDVHDFEPDEKTV